MVTGSTDGIGKEYAKQLALRGINIVLIARNESKLIQVAREIGEFVWNVKTDLIFFFSQFYLAIDKWRTDNEFILATLTFSESVHPVHTKYIVADFSSGREIYARIKQELSSIPVGILGECDSHLHN